MTSSTFTPVKAVILLQFFLLGLLVHPLLLCAQDSKSDYTGFLEMTTTKAANTSRYPLKEIASDFNAQIHASNLEFLQATPGLIKKIREDLGGESLQWRLKDISYRLLYAPENRPEYATLYETYCREVISEVLGALELQSPYARIITLTSESLPLEETDGFTAYIVHDLEMDYRAQYEFSNTAQKKIGIELSGQYAPGEVGSYSSELGFDETGDVYFIHDPYTVWQNNAKNPYTVLMTPVEETLHYLLRSATESAIRTTIRERGGCTLKDAETIVADWISVEEAIVGGLVRQTLIPILERKIGPLPETLVSEDLAVKSTYEKYGKLGEGIRLVDEMGGKACLELYLEDPLELKALL